MIISEFYRTREDGVNLYRIYSNENFEIQNTITLECYADVIEDSADLLNYIELPNKLYKKDKPVLEEEILDGDKELSEEEVAIMLEEVF